MGGGGRPSQGSEPRLSRAPHGQQHFPDVTWHISRVTPAPCTQVPPPGSFCPSQCLPSALPRPGDPALGDTHGADCRGEPGPQEADMLVRDGESECWTTALGSTEVGSWDPQLNVTQAQLLLIFFFFLAVFLEQF